MKRPYELSDLRVTNDRPKKGPSTPLVCYLPRGVRDELGGARRARRDKRRLLSLLTPLVQTGAVQRWK